MNFGDWTPTEEAMNTVIDVLQESLVPNTDVQRTVQKKIAALQNHPDFVNYLLFLLGTPVSFSDDIRSLAGILLKNIFNTIFETINLDTLICMKQILLQLLKDKSKTVRGSVTSLITVVLWKGGLSNWPDLLPYLVTLLDSGEPETSETALHALFKICEEYLINLRESQLDTFDDSIKALLCKFVNCVTSKHFGVRKSAMKILNESLQDYYDSIKKDFDSSSYLNKLLQMAYEEDTEIQKAVCLGFIIFIENRDDVILPHMNNLIEYMLQKSVSPNDEISLQASEFWLACSKLPTCDMILSPYVEKLLPILLKNMRYSDFEISMLVDSIKSNNNNTDNRFDGKLASDEEGYNALDSMDEPYIGWTLRKCSAASLDALSVKFGDNILPIFIPILNQSLNHDDYLVKESAILALGAIAEGCMNGLNIYLPELAQYLIKCMNDSKPVIRIITCWTLSRYMRFIVNEPRHELYFVPAMMILLKHFRDSNKRIQKAALSAFCVFQEEAGHRLVPYIDLILQAYSECFKDHKFGSYFLLYDAIAVFAQAVGNHLNKQQYIDILLPPLMHKFSIIEDYYDDQFLAMAECLSNVAAALETGFLPYAEVVYNKCLVVVTETVTACQNYAEKPEYFDPPDKEPICGAHDLLLAMAFGLKMYFMKFVTNSCLVEQLYYTMQDDLPMIRQPALALFGEIVKMCFPFIALKIHDYIPIVIENLDKRFDGTCNNAAWVIGKLCLVMGKGIEPYTNQILEHYIVILQSGMGSKAMYQTIAISLCTLGLVCPDEVAQQLGIILKPCCQIMRNIRDCEDKYIGFRGLCELVMRNPNALITDFIHFCDAVASWNSPRPDLTEMIRNILLAFKNQCGNNWTQVYDQFPPLLKARLLELYNV